MPRIIIEKDNARAIIEGSRKEIELNSHLSINVIKLNVHIEPRSTEQEPINDPRRLLEQKRESVEEIMARVNKDPPIHFKDVAIELGVNYQTIRKYCKLGLIEGEWSNCGGWFVRRSEIERLKQSPGWVKEFQELAKNKPLETEFDIRHKGRLRVMEEIEDLRRYGEPLNPTHIHQKYAGLYHRARRYFGSWRIATEVCGIHKSQVYKKWDSPYFNNGRIKLPEGEWRRRRQALFAKVRKLQDAGKLDMKTKRRMDKTIWRFFGGWKKLYYLLEAQREGRQDERILSETPIRAQERKEIAGVSL